MALPLLLLVSASIGIGIAWVLHSGRSTPPVERSDATAGAAGPAPYAPEVPSAPRGPAASVEPPPADGAGSKVPPSAETTTTGARAAFEVPMSDDELAVAPRGFLIVTSTPSGVAVSIDGERVGTAPGQFEATDGVHSVEANLDGYQSRTYQVKVHANQAGALVIALEKDTSADPTTGRVNLFGPPLATVSVDGKEVGKIPATVTLKAGLHSFTVLNADGTSFTRTVDVEFKSTGAPAIVSLSAP